VRRLSEALGVALYRREGGRLALTDEGAATAAFGREMVERARLFAADLRGLDAAAPVALAAGEGSTLYLLSDAIRGFTGEGGRLRLLTRGAEAAVADLRARRAHLAVTSLASPPRDLDATRLGDVGQTVLMPADHPLAARASLAVADLDGQRLILPPPGRPHREALEAALDGAGIRLVVGVEAQGWEPMRRFVGMGLGLAVVNAFCPPPPGCVSRPLPALGARTYWLLAPRAAPANPAVARLRGWIEGSLSASQTQGLPGRRPSPLERLDAG
jgi:DNA-binding transcriptional LysR family regulator